jgi:hypothetical protein
VRRRRRARYGALRLVTLGEAYVAFRPSLGLQRRPLRREHTLPIALLLAVASTGCAGAKPKQVGEENNFAETPTSPSQSSDAASSASSASGDKEYVEQKESWKAAAKVPEGSGLNADQKAQMEIALRRGGEKAANCATVVVDAPAGEGSVKVVFDGKKGRCVDVDVGPPFAGTSAESCIKRAFVGEIVIPFEGQRAVPYNIKLAPRQSVDTDKNADSKAGKSKKK